MMRTLTTLEGNRQRLDGGAMFGNAPKALWKRWASPDDLNRIDLSCRTVVIREPGRTLLLETGIGNFFEPKMRERFGVVEDRHVLLERLEMIGLSHKDIDVVVLSHLHFDHAGGLLSGWNGQGPGELLFDNATVVVGRTAWERALNPHPRDRASFIPHLNELLQSSGRLEVVDGETSDLLGSDYRFFRSDGHTPGLLCTEVAMPGGPVVFAADLIPGVPWVHLPITMGYDRFPELLIDEKARLLQRLVERGGRLLFTHDPETALGHVIRDERGRYSVDRTEAALHEWAA